MQIYERSEQFRQQIGNLDLIVNIYNGVQHSLHPVEKPLVQSKLDAVDTALEKGLGVSAARLLLYIIFFTVGLYFCLCYCKVAEDFYLFYCKTCKKKSFNFSLQLMQKKAKAVCVALIDLKNVILMHCNHIHNKLQHSLLLLEKALLQSKLEKGLGMSTAPCISTQFIPPLIANLLFG